MYAEPPPAQETAPQFLFSTKLYESHWQQYYYGYRYYSLDFGRWLSRDPIGEADGPNVYGFVQNAPVLYSDSIGLLSIETSVQIAMRITLEAAASQAQKLYNEWRCAYNELQKAKQEMKRANVQHADKYFHYVGSCEAARKGSRTAADTLGRLREIEELTRQRLLWHLKRYGITFKGLQVKTVKNADGTVRDLLPVEHARDSLEDYQANKTGLDCPAEKSCEECCCKYKVKGL